MKFKRLARQLGEVPVLGPLARKAYRLVSRDHRAALLDRLPENARCVEIGVWKGDFSDQVLKTKHPRLLVLVDPWEYDPTHVNRWYGGAKARSQEDMDRIHRDVVQRFAKHADVTVVRERSDRFLSETDRVFDWIYIDGDHGEEAVYRDLTLSWERIVPGGMIAGDDLFWKEADGSLPVRAAVDRFVAERGCELEILGNQFLISRR